MIFDKKEGPVPMMVIYRAKKGQEGALLQLVKGHWPTISGLGLATSTPARIWKTTDREGRVAFVEMFSWKDAKAPEIAHQTPEVMAVWEPMANVMESIEIAQAELVE
jgi:hypothetical protein